MEQRHDVPASLRMQLRVALKKIVDDAAPLEQLGDLCAGKPVLASVHLYAERDELDCLYCFIHATIVARKGRGGKTGRGVEFLAVACMIFLPLEHFQQIIKVMDYKLIDILFSCQIETSTTIF